MSEAPDIRASDADRERAVERLAAHAVAGRLDATELEQRTAAALSARTVGELDALLADLPPAEAPRSGAHRRRGRRGAVANYLAVMALLVGIWALTGAGYFWPIWPALGWGIVLLGPGGCSARRRHGVLPRRTPAA